MSSSKFPEITDTPKWTVPFEFGFRSGLYQRLKNSGVAFQFVGGSREPWNGGSRGTYGVPTNQPSVDLRLLGQDHCEGYGGKKSAFILQNISSWVTNHSPGIVLLIPGTTNIDGALFANGINHPNAKVYDRMAETWFNGIMDLNLALPPAVVSKRED